MSWGRYIVSCALAVALSLGASPALADSSDLIVGETPVERACKLIDSIPYDPYKVTLEDADAIRAAEEAYSQLPELEQQQLDAQEAANGVLSYGRSLQCASWGLDALTPIDDATTLADGTYTTQVISTCDMGKTTSIRGYKFTVTKIVAKDGHATATIEHATASPDTVKTGGVTYAHSNTDETAHSTFDIPVDLNATFHISQMAKNRTDKTIAIPYEMKVEIDEAKAVPDPVPAEDSEGTGSVDGTDATDTGNAGNTGDTGDTAEASDASDSDKKEKSSGTSKKSKTKSSHSSKTSEASAAPSKTQQQASPTAIAPTPAASSAPRASAVPSSEKSTAKDGSGSGVDGKTAVQKPSATPSASSVAVSKTDGAVATGLEQSDNLVDGQSSGPNHFQVIAICVAILVAIGFAAFSLDYFRRDRKPVRVKGVRLSDIRR